MALKHVCDICEPQDCKHPASPCCLQLNSLTKTCKLVVGSLKIQDLQVGVRGLEDQDLQVGGLQSSRPRLASWQSAVFKTKTCKLAVRGLEDQDLQVGIPQS